MVCTTKDAEALTYVSTTNKDTEKWLRGGNDAEADGKDIRQAAK